MTPDLARFIAFSILTSQEQLEFRLTLSQIHGLPTAKVGR